MTTVHSDLSTVSGIVSTVLGLQLLILCLCPCDVVCAGGVAYRSMAAKEASSTAVEDLLHSYYGLDEDLEEFDEEDENEEMQWSPMATLEQRPKMVRSTSLEPLDSPEFDSDRFVQTQLHTQSVGYVHVC